MLSSECVGQIVIIIYIYTYVQTYVDVCGCLVSSNDLFIFWFVRWIGSVLIVAYIHIQTYIYMVGMLLFAYKQSIGLYKPAKPRSRQKENILIHIIMKLK